ncbi:fructosyl amino acid oxidasesarcosine [Sporothrix schenckii 1099-18]|uniref:FAD dependent oxidoreductase domain-containing protein n=2 Tax=Sporothrix schenckii TaxID=29908 RepID=U7PVW3_SPOS1|nr:fructosyl amino acid oxidasesarcosine [Sporothrix schenckii 1099-18]ERS99061.1 hypothetical protein HMPREF1624_04256 [Sporothrix schenckii ATCC 58251]KJR83285.1 fructosyl amino acid oxidasesarcosine [Sporothrix schenckii 1099-18]
MTFSTPTSILILGSGVFGLSTAEALSRRPEFARTTITVVDRGSGDVGGEDDTKHFPARDAASIDTSRIIRADYADPAYAALADEAQVYWRGSKRPGPGAVGAGNEDDDDYIGGGGRYTESGLVVVADAPDDAAAQKEQDPSRPKKKSGMDYVRESWANVQALAAKDAYLATKLKELPNPEAIRAVVGTGGTTGDWGYLNGASGWADAAASMAWVLRRVQAAGRVQFVRGRVASLEIQTDGSKVVGVRLEDGRTLKADLTIAATGAWTESLVGGTSLAGSLAATGQVLGYVPLVNEEEHAHVASMPVVLNLTSGLFVIPPAPGSRELKVARHSYGYINPASPETGAGVSKPLTHLDNPQLNIPAEGEADLRRGLQQMVPVPGLVDRPFAKTRICWYTDTPTGDFVVDYHPDLEGLFLATGGSGHAFKFLPVLGDKVVDCLVGQRPAAFADKWAWRRQADKGASIADLGWATVVTEDGSRGGKPGLLLQDELSKSSKA